jgi:hypothetical protein
VSIELLQHMTDAGWAASVRRSPATPARPNGKVLRWEATSPDGATRWVERTGPALVACMMEWARTHGIGMIANGIPDVRPQPDAVVEPQGRARAFPGHRATAGTAARVEVGYDPLAAFPTLRAVADAATAWRLADDDGAASASARLSAAIVEVYNANVPLTAIGAVAGMHAASVRNRAIRHMARHGITHSRTGAASGPRHHARKPVPA